jgi:hypothetical protein
MIKPLKIISKDEPEEEYELPAYSDRGDILVEVISINEKVPEFYHDHYETEVHYYDTESSLMWLNEGIGIDYWINTSDVSFPAPGWYVIEDVYGEYYRGTYGVDDDDEEWYHGEIRPARPEEIAALCVIKPVPPTTSPSSE